jgi:GTPase SAR1 family protein
MALKAQKIFVLYGPGGTGKTSIMTKFVDQFSDQYVRYIFLDIV